MDTDVTPALRTILANARFARTQLRLLDDGPQVQLALAALEQIEATAMAALETDTKETQA